MTPPPPTPLLTLPEVVAAIPALLPGDYQGVRSGRVRDLPDVRTIRFYQSTGLVERAAAFRGRTALYGRRHLLQIAAIKKLQAAGLSLGEIQRGLPGKTDAELARSLGVKLDQVDAVISAARSARGAEASAGFEAAMKPARRSGPFWKARPAEREAAARPPADTASFFRRDIARLCLTPPPAALSAEALMVEARIAEAHAAPSASPAPIQSLEVGGGVVLLWNGRPLTPEESAVIEALAAPLVARLVAQSAATSTSPTGGPLPPVNRPSKPPLEPAPKPAPGKSPSAKKEKRR